jgi:phosphopantothenoylcysteine decarboxylase/phosphopantothenate--cysteine ligase
MNANMLASAPIARNLAALAADGWRLVEPGAGHLACGVEGKGRMAEPDSRVPRAGKGPRRVLVTAGPTREHLDPVRYLTNESSGRMGFEIAAAAARRGDRVTLIAGPVALPTPAGVRRIDVTSAREMLAAARNAFTRADALFMCAAVADWRPRRKSSGKLRKDAQSVEFAFLELAQNPDILATLARRKGARLVVGFALETAGGLARARAKLRQKHADYIVWNDARALGAPRARVAILSRDGSVRHLRMRTKRAIAEILVRLGPPGSSGR